MNFLDPTKKTNGVHMQTFTNMFMCQQTLETIPTNSPWATILTLWIEAPR